MKKRKRVNSQVSAHRQEQAIVDDSNQVGNDVEARRKKKKKKKSSSDPCSNSGSNTEIGAVDEPCNAVNVEITNVELMRVLRTSSTPVYRKLELAFQYVDLQKTGPISKGIGVPMPHFITFLADWVQTAIISSSKSHLKVDNVCRDVRSWTVLHWCMSSQTSVHVSPGILRGIEFALRTTMEKSAELENDDNVEDPKEAIMEILVDILEVLLHSYDRIFRPQLLDWASLVSASLRVMLQNIIAGTLHRECLLLKVTTLITEGFASFLTSYSNPKAAFQVTVEKLLDPLLSLMGKIGPQIKRASKGSAGAVEMQKLQESIEKVLENGLFHTIHLDGFPEVCTAVRWNDDLKVEVPEPDVAYATNHKLLFDKIKQIRESKNFAALSVLGNLLRLFIRRFKSHRASANEDLFGVRGAGQQQELDREEQKGTEWGMESKKKHLTDDQRQFLVFVELALPLIQELKKKLGASQCEDASPQISESKELLAAVNGLYLVARDEQIYVPTRDTPSQGHLKFIKQFHNVLVEYAKSVSVVWCRIDSEDHLKKDSACLAAEVFREVICGIGYVLELEDRAAEDHTQNLWLILLTAVALEIALGPRQGQSEAVAELVSLGCKVLTIFSELRNFSSLPILFSSIKSLLLQSDSTGLLFLSSALYEAALSRLFCNEAFLKVIGKTMQVVPEGQAAEIVVMISTDVSETFSLFSTSQSLAVVTEAVVKTLAELYARMLENLNITSTNSLQGGEYLRQFVDSVLKEPLCELLDELLKVKLGKKKIKQAEAGSTTLKAFFLLRLYLLCRILHRQCVSLMPPKKARKANTAAHEIPLDSLELDWMQIALEPVDVSIFSWIGRPEATVSDLLGGLGMISQKTGRRCPALCYVMDRCIIQRLNDLGKYIHSIEYLEEKTTPCCIEDPVMQSLSKENEEAQSRETSDKVMLHNLLTLFTEEAKRLVVLLLDGGELDSIKLLERPLSKMEVDNTSWNGVVSTLTERSMHAARWSLISQTVDLWSRYANKNGLKSFVGYVLNTKVQLNARETQAGFSVAIVTHELLKNIMFYEDQGIESILLPEICKVLHRVLHLGIKFKDMKNFLEKEKWKKLTISKSPVMQQDQEDVSLQSVDKTISLLHLISSFPWGHKRKSTAVQYICCVCHVERFALDSLVNVTQKVVGSANQSTAVLEHGLKLLELFAVCRRTLQSLAFPEEHDEHDTCFSTSFSSNMAEWLYQSIDTASECLADMEAGLFELANEESTCMVKVGRIFLASVLKSTQCFIKLNLKGMFLLGSRCLLVQYPSGVSAHGEGDEIPGTSETISAFSDFCMQQVRNVVEISPELSRVHKGVTPNSEGGAGIVFKDERKATYRAHGAILFASSLLWSATNSIDNLDKKCQEDKGRALRWLSKLPTLWLLFLRELEPMVVTMLLGRFAASDKLDTTTNRVMDVFLESTSEGQEDEEDADEGLDPEGELEVFSDDDDSMEQETQAADLENQETQGIVIGNEASRFLVMDTSQKAALKRLFNGEMREQSEIVGELFMAMGALLKLRSLYFSPYALKALSIRQKAAPLSVSALLGVLYYLLTEAASSVYTRSVDKYSDISWLFGAIKCMESVGILLPSIDPVLAPVDYSKLVRVHIDLLGALISRTNKEPKDIQELQFVDTMTTKLGCGLKVDLVRFYSDMRNAVKDSFGALIKYAPRHHLISALQTIQRALSGVSEVSKFDSALQVSDCDDGKVVPVIAAGVECMAISLDGISGRWRLQLLAKYSPTFIATLFNLIGHLQGPALFFKNLQEQHLERPNAVSSFPVLLQSLEILSRLASREAIFPMKASHVALALHCPAGLLKPFYQSKLPARMMMMIRKYPSQVKVQHVAAEGDAIVKLYVACCKLLYAVLKHRQRESGRSIALLAESIRVLLYCLEVVDNGMPSSAVRHWGVDSAVQCAQWLRRVYEELGERKDTLGRYCNHILSDYLSVLSGSGPSGAGLNREVDKELRPGVYALINACSPSDLQQLHAALADGPLRNNLNMVRQDFEKNFKYTGKI